MKLIYSHFFLYVAGNIAVRGISGFITPLILRHLTPAEYGLLSLIFSAIAVATPLCGLGLRQALALDYFHLTAADRQDLVITVSKIYLLCSIPLTGIILICGVSWGYPDLMGSTLGASALIIIFLSFFVELIFQLLRYEQHAFRLTSIQLASAVITGLCTIALLHRTSIGIASILIGQVAGQVLTCVCGALWWYRTCKLPAATSSICLGTLITHLRTGIIFIPNMLFSWILASSDRWFLVHYASLADVGIYAVADLCCQLFQTLILNAWAGSYLPLVMTQYAQHPSALLKTERTNLRWMWATLMICLSGIAIGFFWCNPLLCWILPVAYHPAISYIWALLAGQVLLLATYFASTLIQFQKKKLFLSCGLLIPATINILLNYLLIPRFGLAGCTTATVCAYCIYFLITLCYNVIIQRQILRRTYEAHSPTYHPAPYAATSIHDRNPSPPDTMAKL